MLAKIAPSSNDFQALARYLVRGKSANPDPKRVAWLFTQNLPTDDPLLAAKYMEATAQLSARTRKAAYHLMIAWHANERPTPEAMRDVARATLQMAGLAEHQALVMGHGDKPHPHLHILLNRIHPDNGRAWKAAHDFARFDRIMRELADAHGFEIAPAHAFNPELTEDTAKQPNSRATYAARRGANTSRPQWSKLQARTVGAEISEQLTSASTADDLHDLLARRALRLEAKGAGHIVGDDRTYAKLSSLGLTPSAKGLARAVRTLPPRRNVRTMERRHGRSVFDVDGVDIARVFWGIGLLTSDDLRQAIDDARLERQSRATRTSALLTSTALTPPVVSGQARLPGMTPGRTPRGR